MALVLQSLLIMVVAGVTGAISYFIILGAFNMIGWFQAEFAALCWQWRTGNEVKIRNRRNMGEVIIRDVMQTWPVETVKDETIVNMLKVVLEEIAHNERERRMPWDATGADAFVQNDLDYPAIRTA